MATCSDVCGAHLAHVKGVIITLSILNGPKLIKKPTALFVYNNLEIFNVGLFFYVQVT